VFTINIDIPRDAPEASFEPGDPIVIWGLAAEKPIGAWFGDLPVFKGDGP